MKRTSLERILDQASVVAGVLMIVSLVWHHMSVLGDGFWSIASGRWILEHGALPHGEDPFSYASAASRWTIDSTGRDVLFALVVRAFGLHGLMIACTLVEALAATLLWVRAQTPGARLALLPMALLYVQVDAQDLSARGQISGDLGFVVLLALLARVRDGKRLRPLVPLLFAALWANLHLSFLIGIALPLAVALLLFLDPPVDRPPPSRFLAFSALALAGSCLTPYGPGYLRFAGGIGFDPNNTIDLFRSPDLHRAWWLVAPAIGVLLILVRGWSGDDRCRRTEQALLLAFVAAAASGRRYSTELVALEIGVAAPLLDRLVRRITQASGLRRLVPALQVGIVFAALPLVTLAFAERHDPYRDVPVQAAVVARVEHEALMAAGARATHVVNPMHWGGYLDYVWNGAPPCLVDGRDHLFLFGNGVFDDAGILWSGAPAWTQVLETYEAGVVLWVRGAALDVYLRHDPRWRLVHADRIAVVYVRVR